ncbi:MAG: Dyp-type peroxidase [Rhodoglobus sp.]
MTEPKGVTRRDVFLAGGGLALGAAGGLFGSAALVPHGAIPATSAGAERVTPFGSHQAGMSRPATPQGHGLIAVFDFLPGNPLTAAMLGALSRAITACAVAQDASVVPDGAGDLTVTVGLGPRVISAIDTTLPGSAVLPDFLDDAVDPGAIGGDLLLAIYSSDAGALSPVLNRLVEAIGDISPRWRQQAYRGTGEGAVVRNPLGFKDGIIVPHGETELAANVWINRGPLAGGTVCVIRRLRLRTADFVALPETRQESIIGRHRVDGSPLSGGGPDAAVNLTAKTPEGELITPPRSHARAAHPSFTGSSLMLRRGYAFANGDISLPDGSVVDDSGLMFICFQNELDTFVKTQQRLDDLDDLRQYTTATASATFLILPGFSANVPLGSTLAL